MNLCCLRNNFIKHCFQTNLQEHIKIFKNCKFYAQSKNKIAFKSLLLQFCKTINSLSFNDITLDSLIQSNLFLFIHPQNIMNTLKKKKDEIDKGIFINPISIFKQQYSFQIIQNYILHKTFIKIQMTSVIIRLR